MRLTSLVLSICLVLASPAVRTQPASADERLRALYTEEWTWRQRELPQPGAAWDRQPRVDAASQQARLAYWTRALAALDAIPFDQLSPDEKVNAQVFRASIQALANDVKFRTYEAPFNADTFFWTDNAASTTRSSRSARCRCRCSISAWRSSSRTAA